MPLGQWPWIISRRGLGRNGWLPQHELFGDFVADGHTGLSPSPRELSHCAVKATVSGEAALFRAKRLQASGSSLKVDGRWGSLICD